MLRFCIRKQISYNSAHPKLYIDTKETMSRGRYNENVFLGSWLMDYLLRGRGQDGKHTEKGIFHDILFVRFEHWSSWNSELHQMQGKECQLCGTEGKKEKEKKKENRSVFLVDFKF